MAKTIVHFTMSLDGFVAKPNDDIGWAFKYETDEMVQEVMGEIGAVVLGKRTFDGTMKNDAVPYGGMVKVPQFVVTHENRSQVTVKGLNFTFVTDGIKNAVELAKAAAGNKSVTIFGASIAQQCLKDGLVDEILIHIAPILLCDGIRLFDHIGSESIELERTEIVSTSQITSLRFRIVK